MAELSAAFLCADLWLTPEVRDEPAFVGAIAFGPGAFGAVLEFGQASARPRR